MSFLFFFFSSKYSVNYVARKHDTSATPSPCTTYTLANQFRNFAPLYTLGSLNWFSSYLNARKLKVVIEPATESSLEIIETGVSQGSVLGPIFSLYICIRSPRQNVECICMYAEDIKIFYSFKMSDLDDAELGEYKTSTNFQKIMV